MKYRGVHSTDELEDGYLGSGKWLEAAIREHGAGNFKREILATFNTPEEMLQAEVQAVGEDWIARPDTYNIIVGGGENPFRFSADKWNREKSREARKNRPAKKQKPKETTNVVESPTQRGEGKRITVEEWLAQVESDAVEKLKELGGVEQLDYGKIDSLIKEALFNIQIPFDEEEKAPYRRELAALLEIKRKHFNERRKSFRLRMENRLKKRGQIKETKRMKELKQLLNP